jgi:hypothetical protein
MPRQPRSQAARARLLPWAATALLLSLPLAAALVPRFAHGQAAPSAQTAQAGPQLQSLRIDSDAALEPGAQLDFELRGTPRGRASVRVNQSDIVVQLREVQPGVYQGSHTVRRSDRIDPLGELRASLSANARTTTRYFEFPPGFQALAQQGGAQATGRAHASREVSAVPYPPPLQQRSAVQGTPAAGTNAMGSAPATLPLRITSHAEQAAVDPQGIVQIHGQTAPGAAVRVRVDAIPPATGQRTGVARTLVSQIIAADGQGNFSFSFDPRDVRVPGMRYEVTVGAGNGHQSAESRVVLMQRG